MIKEEMRAEKSKSRNKEGDEESSAIIVGGGADELEERKMPENYIRVGEIERNRQWKKRWRRGFE